MKNNYFPFVNQPLPYDYQALEPFLDEKTMHLHHDRHLQTYIDNLNAVLEKEPKLQRLSLTQLIQISGRLPCPLQTSIRNNAGGVYNHRFFFEGMANPAPPLSKGVLLQAICRKFGSIDAFLEAFQNAALSVFGLGYAWLVWGQRGLQIVTTPNQNCPIEQGLQPILVIDVWEHAYYLKHYNLRKDYIQDWIQVIHWKRAQQQLESVIQQGRNHSTEK